jgi:putative two-component system response regulator
MELKARVASCLKVKAYNDYVRSHQKELEKEIEKRTRQLQEAYDQVTEASLDTIHRLSRAAEYKDEHTGEHIQRMSHYCVAIGNQLALPAKVLDSILYAAPMHDLGKIGIPDRILLKPRKLNPDEWKIMKQHTIIGAQILTGSRVGYIRLAKVIALTHHERWDGNGYPRGIPGKKIPLSGRICAVADVFDALTSKRPYKSAFSVEKSTAIIKEDSGSRFDPDVVDAFFRARKEIMEIRARYADRRQSRMMEIASVLEK